MLLPHPLFYATLYLMDILRTDKKYTQETVEHILTGLSKKRDRLVSELEAVNAQITHWEGVKESIADGTHV